MRYVVFSESEKSEIRLLGLKGTKTFEDVKSLIPVDSQLFTRDRAGEFLLLENKGDFDLLTSDSPLFWFKSGSIITYQAFTN